MKETLMLTRTDVRSMAGKIAAVYSQAISPLAKPRSLSRTDLANVVRRGARALSDGLLRRTLTVEQRRDLGMCLASLSAESELAHYTSGWSLSASGIALGLDQATRDPDGLKMMERYARFMGSHVGRNYERSTGATSNRLRTVRAAASQLATNNYSVLVWHYITATSWESPDEFPDIRCNLDKPGAAVLNSAATSTVLSIDQNLMASRFLQRLRAEGWDSPQRDPYAYWQAENPHKPEPKWWTQPCRELYAMVSANPMCISTLVPRMQGLIRLAGTEWDLDAVYAQYCEDLARADPHELVHDLIWGPDVFSNNMAQAVTVFWDRNAVALDRAATKVQYKGARSLSSQTFAQRMMQATLDGIISDAHPSDLVSSRDQSASLRRFAADSNIPNYAEGEPGRQNNDLTHILGPVMEQPIRDRCLNVSRAFSAVLDQAMLWESHCFFEKPTHTDIPEMGFEMMTESTSPHLAENAETLTDALDAKISSGWASADIARSPAFWHRFWHARPGQHTCKGEDDSSWYTETICASIQASTLVGAFNHNSAKRICNLLESAITGCMGAMPVKMFEGLSADSKQVLGSAFAEQMRGCLPKHQQEHMLNRTPGFITYVRHGPVSQGLFPKGATRGSLLSCCALPGILWMLVNGDDVAVARARFALGCSVSQVRNSAMQTFAMANTLGAGYLTLTSYLVSGHVINAKKGHFGCGGSHSIVGKVMTWNSANVRSTTVNPVCDLPGSVTMGSTPGLISQMITLAGAAMGNGVPEAVVEATCKVTKRLFGNLEEQSRARTGVKPASIHSGKWPDRLCPTVGNIQVWAKECSLDSNCPAVVIEALQGGRLILPRGSNVAQPVTDRNHWATWLQTANTNGANRLLVSAGLEQPCTINQWLLHRYQDREPLAPNPSDPSLPFDKLGEYTVYSSQRGTAEPGYVTKAKEDPNLAMRPWPHPRPEPLPPQPTTAIRSFIEQPDGDSVVYETYNANADSEVSRGLHKLSLNLYGASSTVETKCNVVGFDQATVFLELTSEGETLAAQFRQDLIIPDVPETALTATAHRLATRMGAGLVRDPGFQHHKPVGSRGSWTVRRPGEMPKWQLQRSHGVLTSSSTDWAIAIVNSENAMLDVSENQVAQRIDTWVARRIGKPFNTVCTCVFDRACVGSFLGTAGDCADTVSINTNDLDDSAAFSPPISALYTGGRYRVMYDLQLATLLLRGSGRDVAVRCRDILVKFGPLRRRNSETVTWSHGDVDVQGRTINIRGDECPSPGPIVLYNTAWLCLACYTN
jgi:hypothetical protein